MIKTSIDEPEQYWKADEVREDWKLPKKAFFLLRLPIVRRFRAAFHESRVYRQAINWLCPNQYDLWVLYAIRRGWC